MEQHEAVKKMMLSIKLQEGIPDIYHSYLRELFRQMYVVGWEEGLFEINQHGNKPIGQFDNSGKILINAYKSLKYAARTSGYSEKGIVASMQRHRPMKAGWTWRYLTEKEITTDIKRPTHKKNWLIS